MLRGRFVHVGKSLTDVQIKFWAVNCIKMRLAAGSACTSWGSYSAPADP